jgi:hypothetical protein
MIEASAWPLRASHRQKLAMSLKMIRSAADIPQSETGGDPRIAA